MIASNATEVSGESRWRHLCPLSSHEEKRSLTEQISEHVNKEAFEVTEGQVPQHLLLCPLWPCEASQPFRSVAGSVSRVTDSTFCTLLLPFTRAKLAKLLCKDNLSSALQFVCCDLLWQASHHLLGSPIYGVILL